MQMKFSNFIMILSIASLLSNFCFAQIWTGTHEIKINSHIKLVMPNRVNPDCSVAGRSQEIDCSPNTTLNLIYKGKHFSYDNLIAPWKGSFFIYFVKLGSNSYARDLNQDGLKEIAIYPAVCGNSPKSVAYIYTVNEHELVPYGTGVYFWEAGLPLTDIKKDPKFKPDI